MERMDKQLKLTFSHIKSLVEQNEFGQALAECEKLLFAHPENSADVLRIRAFVYASSGDYASSLRDREKILELSECMMKDYYLAAEQAIYAGQFAKATTWLKETVRLGHSKNDTWFESSSNFLLAYAQLELGNCAEALKYLDMAVNLENDIAMPLPNTTICTHSELRDLILARM